MTLKNNDISFFAKKIKHNRMNWQMILACGCTLKASPMILLWQRDRVDRIYANGLYRIIELYFDSTLHWVTNYIIKITYFIIITHIIIQLVSFPRKHYHKMQINLSSSQPADISLRFSTMTNHVLLASNGFPWRFKTVRRPVKPIQYLLYV